MYIDIFGNTLSIYPRVISISFLVAIYRYQAKMYT